MSQQLETALITGASSGIGTDFAHELATRGYHLIISARRRDRLDKLKTELETKYKIGVEVVVADLGQPNGGEQLFQAVRLLSRPVSFLVNNAGLGRYGDFTTQAMADIEAMIQVNLSSLTVLTRQFAGQMVTAGGGYILNTGSFSAIQPPPDYAVYAGTKSYVLAFSQALNEQLKRRKVYVCSLCPGFFESEFFAAAGQEPSFLVRMMMLNRRKVARAGINGVLRGKAVVIPGVGYKLLNMLMRATPRSFATRLADFGMKH